MRHASTLPSLACATSLLVASSALPAMARTPAPWSPPDTIGALSDGTLNTRSQAELGLQPNGLETMDVVAVVVGDANADGLQDVYALSADDTDGDGLDDTSVLTVLLGTGDGRFSHAHAFDISDAGPDGFIATAMNVNDGDGDGLSDAWIAGTDGADWGLLRLSGAALHGPMAEAPSQLTFVNHDCGNGDILVAMDGAFNLGSGTPVSVRAGDFDADGEPDALVALAGETDRLALVLSGGSNDSATLRGLHIDDLNGDGTDDVVVATANNLRLLVSDGSEGFIAIDIPVSAGGFDAFVAIDIPLSAGGFDGFIAVDIPVSVGGFDAFVAIDIPLNTGGFDEVVDDVPLIIEGDDAFIAIDVPLSTGGFDDFIAIDIPLASGGFDGFIAVDIPLASGGFDDITHGALLTSDEPGGSLVASAVVDREGGRVQLVDDTDAIIAEVSFPRLEGCPFASGRVVQANTDSLVIGLRAGAVATGGVALIRAD